MVFKRKARAVAHFVPFPLTTPCYNLDEWHIATMCKSKKIAFITLGLPIHIYMLLHFFLTGAM